jgi:hypothetical protein
VVKKGHGDPAGLSMRSWGASSRGEALRFWAPEADEKLLSLIRGMDEASDLIRGVREIDVWLARDPLDFGESR